MFGKKKNKAKVKKEALEIIDEERIDNIYLRNFMKASKLSLIVLNGLNLGYRQCRLLQRIFPMSSHSCLKLRECTLSDKAIIELKEIGSKLKGFYIYELKMSSTNQLKAFTNMLEFLYSIGNGYNKLGCNLKVDYSNYDVKLFPIVRHSIRQQMRIFEKNMNKFNKTAFSQKHWNHYGFYTKEYFEKIMFSKEVLTGSRYDFNGEKDIVILCTLVNFNS